MNQWAVLAFLAAAALVLFDRPAPAAPGEPEPEPQPWAFDPFADWPAALDFGAVQSPDEPPPQLPAPVSVLWAETQDMFAAPVPFDQAARNERAMLDLIAWAEGTADLGDNGYNVRFGRVLFHNGYVDHPRIAVQFTNLDGRRLWTSAAGRYQFMAVSPLPTGGSTRTDTWDRLQQLLQLPDFSPASQDRACLELIRQRGALADVRAGRIQEAIAKCAPTWASLPGANYAQRERQLPQLLARFTQAGGTLET